MNASLMALRNNKIIVLSICYRHPFTQTSCHQDYKQFAGRKIAPIFKVVVYSITAYISTILQLNVDQHISFGLVNGQVRMHNSTTRMTFKFY